MTTDNDKRIVEKLLNEGVGYCLVDYFSKKELEKIDHAELREACLRAKEILLLVDKIIDRDFGDIS